MRRTGLSKLFITMLVFLLMTLPSLQGQDHKKVKAASGDGIYSLLRKNGLDPSAYYEEFIQLNKNNLDDDLQLIKGRSYLLPVPPKKKETGKSKTGVYPVFGKDYEKITFKDDQLKGAVYYLLAGHGGPDPGAIGNKEGHRLCEDEYAYDVTLRIAKNLIEHNATVYIIIKDPNDGIRDDEYLKCDKDEYCGNHAEIPFDQNARLKQRTNEINRLYGKHRGSYQRMVEIHVDSRYSGKKIDIFFYHHKNSTAGKKFCTTLYKTIKAKYDHFQPNRGYYGTVESRNLYTLNNADPVTAFIELGNINHTGDQRRLLNPSQRQAMANWLTNGMIEDFKNARKK